MQERTGTNVHTAFVGESKAYVRLLAFAEKADKEGLPQIAKLFRAVASSELIHASRNFRQLEAVKDTQTNLEYAFQQEQAVNGNHYPKMIREAQEDGDKAAALIFSQARDVEEGHATLYKKALQHLIDDADTTYYVCTVCGYLHEGEPTEACPVCNAPVSKFRVTE